MKNILLQEEDKCIMKKALEVYLYMLKGETIDIKPTCKEDVHLEEDIIKDILKRIYV